jgi:hypothetical protein
VPDKGVPGADGSDAGILDGLVARVLDTYPFRFTVAESDDQRELAYALRCRAAIDAGWATADDFPDGMERDEFDADAVHVIGWDGDEPVSAGRLVVPPHALPTERAAGIVVEPPGRVVDVGRMVVSSDYQGFRHGAFIALLCRLYLEMRRGGYEVACGMMSTRARQLVTQLGLRLETLADEREYWGESRAPVRFALTVNATTLPGMWTP